MYYNFWIFLWTVSKYTLHIGYHPPCIFNIISIHIFIPLSIHCITLTTKFFHQYWNNLIPVFTSILHEWYTNLLKIFPSQHNRNVCFHPSNPSSLYQLWPDKLIKDFTANDSNIFIRRFRIRPKTSMLILNIHPR